jgi:hypothetical protein
MKKRIFGIYVCKKHGHGNKKFPRGFVHQIHRITNGRIMINHIEPYGFQSISEHKKEIRYKII